MYSEQFFFVAKNRQMTTWFLDRLPADMKNNNNNNKVAKS
jgi:hypothetical protein